MCKMPKVSHSPAIVFFAPTEEIFLPFFVHCNKKRKTVNTVLTFDKKVV